MYQAAHHSIVCFSKTRKQLKEMLKNYGSGSQASTCRCSVPQSCLTLCEPVDCSTSGFPVHHQLPELAQTHVHRVGHPTISSSVIPFSSQLQSFSASGSFTMTHFFASGGQIIGVSASSEYSGLISLMIDRFDLFAVQGTLKNLLQHHSSKASILQHSSFFTVLRSWDFPDKNARVGYHFLLQGKLYICYFIYLSMKKHYLSFPNILRQRK